MFSLVPILFSDVAPDVTLNATLVGVGELTAELTTRPRRVEPPRREYVWVYGLDGELKAVIT